MNLLAHAILSPPNPAILTGNLIADWVKGKARHALPPEIQVGITLHRRIDAFTDTHHLVAQTCELLAPNWGRYSPVLTDIFFDHLLAAHWSRHHPAPLKIFRATTYLTLHEHRLQLPPLCQAGIDALSSQDWFSTYATLDGIRLTLARISTRLRHGIDLAPSVDDFCRHQAAFETAFESFFPQLKAHAETPPPLPNTLIP